jgi:hypothetical protein
MVLVVGEIFRCRREQARAQEEIRRLFGAEADTSSG